MDVTLTFTHNCFPDDGRIGCPLRGSTTDRRVPIVDGAYELPRFFCEYTNGELLLSARNGVPI